MKEFFAHCIDPSSPHRAKLSVHLIAQAKPEEASIEDKRTEAIAALTTILQEEKLTPVPEKLEARLESCSTNDSVISAVSAHLVEDVKLEKEKLNKVLDGAKATLGLAKVDEALKDPEVLQSGNVAKKGEDGSGTAPVIITDVHAFKTGLLLSTGMKPVRDLSEFVEDSSKL
jgi:insulysin